jgi:hypothetical protein
MLVEVEITSQAITAQYGTLSTGDILRTDAEFAKHLVEDCGAAKYLKAPAAASEVKQEAPKAAEPVEAPVAESVAEPVPVPAPEAPAEATAKSARAKK